MATDSPFSFFNQTDYGEYEEPQYINKSAQIGCWITFIVWTLLLNAVVIACIFRLYSKSPSTKLGSPKLLAILACCVVQIVDAAVPSAMAVHLNRVGLQTLKSSWTCGTLVFLELISFVFSAVVTLLIAIVILLEGLKLQRFVQLTAKMQMVAAVVLVVLAGVYAAVVVTPIFFVFWLEDGAHPCGEEYFGLRISSDQHRTRIINVVQYIVPHCGVFSAFFLLLVAYVTRRRNASSSPYVQYYYPAAPAVPLHKSGDPASNDPPGYVTTTTTDVTTTTAATDVSNPTNDVSSAPRIDNAGSPLVHITTTTTPTPTTPYLQPQPQPQPHGANPLVGEQQAGGSGFPWYTLCAAVASLVLGFVFFFPQFHELSLRSAEMRRLWAAGVLLSALRGVFLPCCWLLDRELRSACCSGCSRERSAGHVITDGSRRQEEISVRL